MSKYRVHEVAKEINVTSRDLVEKLQSKGYEVKNHMSTLTEKEVGTIKEIFSSKKTETKEVKEAKPEIKAEVKKPQYDKSVRAPQGKTTNFRERQITFVSWLHQW